MYKQWSEFPKSFGFRDTIKVLHQLQYKMNIQLTL